MTLILRLCVLLGLISIAMAATNSTLHKNKKEARSRPNYDFIEYYDCSGKDNGNYIHPTDCTRFITCSNGYASDMACPDCDTTNDLCAGGQYLRYDASVDVNRCEWPKNTECVTDPGQDPDPSTTTTTTEPTTTRIPDDDNPHTCQEIRAGESCHKNECQPCGYCFDRHSFYFRCNRTFPSDPKLEITGEWVHEACDDDLWWNPDRKPSAGVEEGFGGACDRWENLSENTQNKYKEDPNCVSEVVVCEWGQDDQDNCTGRYWYFDPKTDADRQILSCSEGLIWDKTTETCRECQHVEGCGCN